jgi:hypothetical protein
LVFIKKSNQTENFLTGSDRPVSVYLGFLGQKLVWLDFSGLARFSWFFPGLGSIWFGFLLIKLKPNQTSRFF